MNCWIWIILLWCFCGNNGCGNRCMCDHDCDRDHDLNCAHLSCAPFLDAFSQKCESCDYRYHGGYDEAIRAEDEQADDRTAKSRKRHGKMIFL